MSKKSNGNLSAPNIVSTGIDVTKNNFKDLFILACIFIVIPSILLGLVSFGTALSFTNSIFRSGYPLYSTSVGLGGFFILLILSLLIGVWTTAGSFSIIKLTHNRNTPESNTWKDTMKFGISKLGTSVLFLLFSLLVGLIIGIGITLIGLAGSLIVALISSLSTTLGVLLAIIGIIFILALSIYVSMYLVFICQGIAINNLGVWESFKLSVKIVNGRVWNVFVKQFLVGLLIFIIALIACIFNFIPFLGYLLVTIITSILTVYGLVCVTLMFDDYTVVDSSETDV